MQHRPFTSERSLGYRLRVIRSARAEPLAPEERRLAIIEAVLPLLVARGTTVTTRQMAEAAGIAEGTLFGVFPDKHALIRAAIEHRLDPEPLRAGLGGIDSTLPLAAQLLEVARVTKSCSEEAIALFGVLRILSPKETPNEPPPFVTAWGEAVISGIAALLEPYAAQLRLEPPQVAALLLDLMFARQRSLAAPEQQPSLEETIDVLLHGALTSTKSGETACS